MERSQNMEPCSQALRLQYRERHSTKRISDPGYESMASNESETFETTDFVDGPDREVNINVQFEDSPYYMQVENQSGNPRGRIIVVKEVQNLDNVNALFTERVDIGNQVFLTLQNSSVERDMVVEVETVKENAPLVLLNKKAQDSLNQWTVEFKSPSSNAYFSLSKTYNGETYCAMPSLDVDSKIPLILKKKSDTIEQHVFSYTRRTPVATSSFITLTGCTKHTHQTQITMQRKNSLQYLHVNDHHYAVTTTDPSRENALLSWTNLARKEGYFIELGLNNRLLGVQRIGDGEAVELQKPADKEFNTTIKVEFYKNNAADVHFALCFISPLNGRAYYVTPTPIGEPLRIYNFPKTDVHVFRVGEITCLNGEGICTFKRLMSV